MKQFEAWLKDALVQLPFFLGTASPRPGYGQCPVFSSLISASKYQTSLAGPRSLVGECLQNHVQTLVNERITVLTVAVFEVRIMWGKK